MGALNANQSQTIVNNYMQEINSVVATAVTNANLQTTTILNSTFSLCGPACYIPGEPLPVCIIKENVTLSQTAGTQAIVDTAQTVSIVQNSQNAISTTTQNFINQSSTSDQGWLSTALGININDINQVINVSDQIANYVATTAKLNCTANTFTEENLNVNVCGYVQGNFIVNQNAATNVVFSCVNKQIVNFFASNTERANNVNKADQTALAMQEGATTFLDYIIYAFVIITVVMLVIGLITHLSRANKPVAIPQRRATEYRDKNGNIHKYPPGQGPLLPANNANNNYQRPQQRNGFSHRPTSSYRRTANGYRTKLPASGTYRTFANEAVIGAETVA
jgi:hypothetical protein